MNQSKPSESPSKTVKHSSRYSKYQPIKGMVLLLALLFLGAGGLLATFSNTDVDTSQPLPNLLRYALPLDLIPQAFLPDWILPPQAEFPDGMPTPFEGLPKNHPKILSPDNDILNDPSVVVKPTGKLLQVFEETRKATLQIESRSRMPVFMSFVEGIGTGFFISPSGQILTAYHVVERARDKKLVGIDVNNKEYNLTLVSFDAYLDLALLQADIIAPVPYLSILEATLSKKDIIGEEVLAIGNSRGDFLEARAGIVTRLGVSAKRPDFADGTIELTAALAPGDSGGPVINDAGEVLGVVSYISVLSTDKERFIPPFLHDSGFVRRYASYAVPISQDSPVVMALRSGESNDVPVIGFSLFEDYEPTKLGEALGLGSLAGPVVNRVQAGSPADLAGLRDLVEYVVEGDSEQVTFGRRIEADVIVAVDDDRTRDFNELLAVIRKHRIGDTVVLTVQRGDKTVKLPLELGARAKVFY